MQVSQELKDSVPEYIQIINKDTPEKVIKRRMQECSDYLSVLRCVKELYELKMPAINEAMQKKGRYRPYQFREVYWPNLFTPIEKIGWEYLRNYPALDFYPQFPVAGYWLDFADPQKKIAIEMDGAEWHNPERDTIRDEKLSLLGWKVFRIPGKECSITPYEINEDEVEYQRDFEKLGKWMTGTVAGVIESIKTLYYFKLNIENDYNRWKVSFAIQSLKTHKLAQFDL
jgi:very-short-patch-repair endonuclease